MPVTKGPGVRIRIIDQLLRNTMRKYGRDGLLSALNEKLLSAGYPTISKRQLQNDINYMRSEAFGNPAPIEYDRRGKFYYYSDQSYNLLNFPLSIEDLAPLYHATAILRQFTGLGYGEELGGLADKLEKQLASSSSKPNTHISFELPQLKGREFIYGLHQAILEQQSLLVEYKPYHHKEPNQWVVHPYHLKEYNNRWFLLAKSHEMQYVMTLALDRLLDYKIAEEPHQPYEGLDFRERYKNVLGVTIPQEQLEPQSIVLRFNKDRGQYVKTKPIHHSQRIIQETECHIDISLCLILNKELVSMLLRFGASLQILSPLELKQQVLDELNRWLQLYG